jgi:hypothetical protein
MTAAWKWNGIVTKQEQKTAQTSKVKGKGRRS